MRLCPIATLVVASALLLQAVSTCDAVEERAQVSTAGQALAVLRPRALISLPFERPHIKLEAPAAQTAQHDPAQPLPLGQQVRDQITRQLQDRVDEDTDRLLRRMVERLPKL